MNEESTPDVLLDVTLTGDAPFPVALSFRTVTIFSPVS